MLQSLLINVHDEHFSYSQMLINISAKQWLIPHGLVSRSP